MLFANDNNIYQLVKTINESDAVVIGAGSGLSTAAGFTYSGDRFNRYFQDFIDKYHFSDMYSASFYSFDSLEEYWAYWSRFIYYNRYVKASKDTYSLLYQLVKGKDYFVITTNVDHQFQIAGFDKNRLFYTQGDYGLFQCSKPCHQKTYDNHEIILQMLKLQKDMKIPSSLIPYCPICHEEMTMNLRVDDKFVEDEGWHRACNNYKSFINKYAGKKIVYLELGVGANTPGIIKYPFWRLTYQNPNAIYVCINQGEAIVPKEIRAQSISFDQDINDVLIKATYLVD